MSQGRDVSMNRAHWFAAVPWAGLLVAAACSSSNGLPNTVISSGSASGTQGEGSGSASQSGEGATSGQGSGATSGSASGSSSGAAGSGTAPSGGMGGSGTGSSATGA